MKEDRYEKLVREFPGKKRIAIWGVEDAKADPGPGIGASRILPPESVVPQAPALPPGLA